MKLKLFALALALAMAGSTTQAQRSPMGGMGSPGSGVGDLAPFFGENKSFNATAEVKTSASSGKTMTISMKFAALDGKIRTEIDLTGMKGSPMPPQQAAMMKQMGMEKSIIIVQPEKKSVLMIYPGLKAYAAMNTPGGAPSDPAKKPKVEKSAVGRENIDGHDCEKNKVIVTDDSGKQHEALVWNASDLKGFPVQIEVTQNGSTTTTKFTSVSMDKPDAGLFEPPSDFTKYDNIQQLMQETMMKNAANFRPRQ